MTPKLLVHGRLQHGVGHSARIRQAAAGVLHQHDEGVRVRIVEQKAREPRGDVPSPTSAVPVLAQRFRPGKRFVP